MKAGRLILTHREDLIAPLRDFYLGKGRTGFLVIGYNPETVDPKKFEESGSFKLVPYFGEGADPGRPSSVAGQQWRVWPVIARQFPEITDWVIHDYDFLCKPADSEILKHVGPSEYAMIGQPFPVWQEGMGEANVDNYPFPEGYRYWFNADLISMTGKKIRKVLLEEFPYAFHGVNTCFGGYGDFIATSSANLMMLEDPKVKTIDVGGLELVPHTLWHAKGVKAVEMRHFFKVKVFLDVLYLYDDNRYDMINPVKIWEGSPSLKLRIANAKLKLKKAVKQLIRYQGWRTS